MVEQTMVERVATAICSSEGCECGVCPSIVKKARAAIKAMREPTEAMLVAPHCEADGCDAQYLEAEDFRHAWQAMIDAALKS